MATARKLIRWLGAATTSPTLFRLQQEVVEVILAGVQWVVGDSCGAAQW